MLKKTLSLILATALACSAGSALALNYSGSQGNEATFELLEEARVSAPASGLTPPESASQILRAILRSTRKCCPSAFFALTSPINFTL